MDQCSDFINLEVICLHDGKDVVLFGSRFCLTHYYLETHKRVIGKQCGPRSDTKCGVLSGSTSFANKFSIKKE